MPQTVAGLQSRFPSRRGVLLGLFCFRFAMPIVKRDFRAGGYHVANDAPFLDESLSWAAKGVLGYLFSKPDDWTPRMYDIVQSGPCKKHRIKSVFEELEDHGYMKREKVRNDDGTFDWVVTVSDHPRFDPGWTESTPDAVQAGSSRGYNNTDSQSDGHTVNTDTNGSSGGARARMPDQLRSVYDTYAPTVDEYLQEYNPQNADMIVSREWGTTSVGSATIRLASSYSFPLFVSGVVITAHEARNPNARYLDTLLSALYDLQHNDTDYTETDPDDAKSDLQRLWNAAKEA